MVSASPTVQLAFKERHRGHRLAIATLLTITLSGCDTLDAVWTFHKEAFASAAEDGSLNEIANSAALGATAGAYASPSSGYTAPTPTYAGSNAVAATNTREALAYQDTKANASKNTMPSAYATKSSATAAPSGRTYRTADHCVSYDDSSNSLADFFENRCNFPVWITFLNQNGVGAAGPIKPGKRETVSKGKGKVEWAACEYPASARAGTTMRDPAWRGGQYACVSAN
ncbi:hypothetical protein F1536_07640 [Achromobacter xylosoxidans]|uniref:hypothetical protein n=1 Tax=Achromobacter TaxID=222 RepID=UPI0006BF133D|nr:hypothetical protein [Achromobacter xylosoxidans]KAA5925500.1 hypothetical protein F1536_07640 [Achromobacter xylosoxidans]MCM2573863.1 hypothetical protein [Achromobacter xylosoxidans]MCZ8384180.1 hypothetical protein [Achromobacter xylosoxidans]QKI68311.1 hypothetical protein HPS44_00930 [Achromobacter xylosoxidans]CUI51590.1 Uncharacterised protein [Achromobacter xylosoxidans]